MQARVTNNDPNNRRLQLADGTVEVGIVRNGQAIDSRHAVDHRAGPRGGRLSDFDRQGRLELGDGPAREPSTSSRRSTRSRSNRAARWSRAARHRTRRSRIRRRSAFDSFDDFNAQRDRTMVAALNASPNLNPSIAGYDNLDAYGQWQDVAGYGQVWVPDQTSGWAPYRDGSWVWEGGYGWTWVGCRAVGLGAVSLRPLVLGQRLRLGLVSAAYAITRARMVAGTRRILRIRRRRTWASGTLRSASAIRTSAGARSRPMRRTIRGIRAGPGPASDGAGRVGLRRFGGFCGGHAHRERHEHLQRLSQLPSRRRQRNAGRPLPPRDDLRTHDRGDVSQLSDASERSTVRCRFARRAPTERFSRQKRRRRRTSRGPSTRRASRRITRSPRAARSPSSSATSRTRDPRRRAVSHQAAPVTRTNERAMHGTAP